MTENINWENLDEVLKYFRECSNEKKQEVVNECEKKYQEEPTEKIAITYANILASWSDDNNFTQNDIKEIVQEIKEIYDKYPNLDVASPYAWVLVNLSRKQDDKKEIQPIADTIKIIYEEHNRDVDIAIRYAWVLENLSRKQDDKEEIQPIADTIKIINEEHNRDVRIASTYAWALVNLSNKQNSKEEIRQTVDKIEAIYEEQNRHVDIAIQYAWTLKNLSSKQDSKEEIQQTVDKVKEIYDIYNDKIDIASPYAWIIRNLLLIENDLLKEGKDIDKNLIKKIDFLKNNNWPIDLDIVVLYMLIFNYIMEIDTEKLYDVFSNLKIRVTPSKPESEELSLIFDKISDYPKRGEIKVELLLLYMNAMYIKRELKYKTQIESNEDNGICHYTKIETLKYILGEDKDKNPLNLRISNSQYMNDPSEGETFIQLLKVKGKTTQNKDLTNILNELYQDSGTNKREKINNSNIYLLSFSRSIDKLPMWSQYGKNGEGCCLIVNNDFFDKKENYDYDINAINHSQVPPNRMDDNQKPERKISQKYVPYRVAYVKNNLIEGEINNNINNLINEIVKSLIKLGELKQEMKETIKNIDEFILGTLDQVRFLFKDSSYEHEKELRIVKFSKQPKLDDTSSVPKLYIDIDKKIEYKEVILGPKVARPSEIAPYIYHTGRVESVTRSAIQYR
ncbi:DUF2971 domain-containing protein [Paludicola sp. MB14-C6]|uniref:DUF2971 domain-containing protein n=1 Tax=Paludihabitans sp. MB14-C6 TaxID=3070656 RepID=UPI0027DC3D88|nr:DUF2971 domain-containing protein [Paludicola sp. MB14-C6]WMJ22963.1 DUF2971 domain-containing protein [Paludicola sp. MB14-C6]